MKLKAENLSKSYGNKKVVNGLSMIVETGSVVGLLGPNGAGKTTTFYMITGMINSDGGNIYFDDINITNEPMYKRARRGIGYLPQESSVFRNLSVEDNLTAILQMIGISGKEQTERKESLLERLKIGHLRKRKSSKLSGGERRRVEIARALTVNPSFLLLDEPFTGIDPKVRQDIQGIIRELASDNIGVIITDHNVRETLEIIDIAHIIYEGNLLITGTAEELIKSDKARELYLGDKFRI